MELGIIGIAALFVLLAMGVHIGLALLLVGIAGMTSMIGFEASIAQAPDAIYGKIASYDLVTIPLFVLMGYLASAGGVSKNLFDALNAWVGRLRGGLGMSTVVSCTAFGTVCGSSLVTSSVFAKLCAPEMRNYGYDKKVAYGICSSGGMIGMLIPPSILMVVYGIQSGESIGDLLIAGVTPGLLLMVLFSISIVIMAVWFPKLINEKRDAPRVPWPQKFKLLLGIWQIILVAVVIFGGIFGGWFNPTEAAAVATALLMVILCFTRGIRWKGVRPAGLQLRELWRLLSEAFGETAATTCMIFLVMAGAQVFSQFLVFSGVTGGIADWVMANDFSRTQMLWIFIAAYCILGCFLDSTSMVCITVPVFNPIIVDNLGANPIWYAVVAVMAMEVGLLTPPVGLNVYGAYAVAEKDVSLEDIFAGGLPFFISVWLAIIILVTFPDLSIFLPDLINKKG